MWAKKGIRPTLSVCQKRDKVYLCGFVEPMTGVWLSYLLPALSGDWYGAVLRLLAEHFDHEPIKLIVDQAGWHTSANLKVPENVCLEFLPSHSPELNPTEQIWPDVRYKYTRNQTFTDRETLWDTLEQVMKVYSAERERVRLITNQNWMYGKKQA